MTRMSGAIDKRKEAKRTLETARSPRENLHSGSSRSHDLGYGGTEQVVSCTSQHESRPMKIWNADTRRTTDSNVQQRR